MIRGFYSIIFEQNSLLLAGANVFAFKKGSNKSVCPVRGLEVYFNICTLLGIMLAPGFLFRSVTNSNTVSPRCLESAAAQARLEVYTSLLSKHLSSDHFTTHGFRSGAAVSLALEGVSLHEIMDHVGWKSSKTALHYIKLKQVVNPAGAAAGRESLTNISITWSDFSRPSQTIRMRLNTGTLLIDSIVDRCLICFSTQT